MNDNFAFVDSIYRSRLTLLDILEMRNYDVAMYRKFSPAEAAAAATALPGLSFTVYKKAEAQQDDEKHECQVRYINNMTRPKLETFFDDIPEERTEHTEVIIMQQGPIADAHHAIALKQYMKMKELPTGEKVRAKLRVSFFCMDMIVVNPMSHVLVPKHDIIPESEHKSLMASMYITTKSKFPEIKFHIDPIARCIGAVPGDIIKITRPSASAGVAIIYRVCAP
jgi:DNA-directed RNA polymerase subunit H